MEYLDFFDEELKRQCELGLSENKQIAILLIVVTLIGIAGHILQVLACWTPVLRWMRDVYVDSYRADLYLNGKIEENFVYVITESGKYRMLYRNWQPPLSTEKLDTRI